MLLRMRKRQWPKMLSSNASLSQRLFIEIPERLGLEASCVARLFSIRSPLSEIVNWVATPAGMTLAPGVFNTSSRRKGMSQPFETSEV